MTKGEEVTIVYGINESMQSSAVQYGFVMPEACLLPALFLAFSEP